MFGAERRDGVTAAVWTARGIRDRPSPPARTAGAAASAPRPSRDSPTRRVRGESPSPPTTRRDEKRVGNFAGARVTPASEPRTAPRPRVLRQNAAAAPAVLRDGCVEKYLGSAISAARPPGPPSPGRGDPPLVPGRSSPVLLLPPNQRLERARRAGGSSTPTATRAPMRSASRSISRECGAPSPPPPSPPLAPRPRREDSPGTRRRPPAWPPPPAARGQATVAFSAVPRGWWPISCANTNASAASSPSNRSIKPDVRNTWRRDDVRVYRGRSRDTRQAAPSRNMGDRLERRRRRRWRRRWRWWWRWRWRTGGGGRLRDLDGSSLRRGSGSRGSPRLRVRGVEESRSRLASNSARAQRGRGPRRPRRRA